MPPASSAGKRATIEYELGPWRVRPSEGVLSRRGKEQRLEPKVMEVLLYLLRHPDRVVSKEELLDAVWPGTYVEEVAVSRCLSEIRRALGDDAHQPRYIETLPKRGLRVLAPVEEVRPTPRWRRWHGGVLAVVVLLAVGILLVAPLERSPPGAEASIAVLPLNNLGEDAEQEYFAAGITEDLIAELSKIEGMKVISRTSAARYARTDKSIPEIGRELGVSSILEGSVRLEGDRVRIAAQLIDVRTDSHLWTVTYDRNVEDLLMVQAEVAASIAGALQMKLSPLLEERLAARRTANPEAYSALLRGREYLRRYRRADNENAIKLFERAIAVDPALAEAHAGLAEALALEYLKFGQGPPLRDRALAAAEEALRLDPRLAPAHKAVGLVHGSYGRVDEAEAAFLRAVESQPGYVAAIENLAVLYRVRGEADEALRWAYRRSELDPLTPSALVGYADPLRQLGMWAEARGWYERALVLEPLYLDAHLGLAYLEVAGGELESARERVDRMLDFDPECCLLLSGDVALLRGQLEAAEAAYRRLWELSGGLVPFASLRLGQVHLLQGRPEEARKLLGDAAASAHRRIEAGDRFAIWRWLLAGVASVEGSPEEALRWYEAAFEEGRVDLALDKADLAFANLWRYPDSERLEQRIQSRIREMRLRALTEGWVRPPRQGDRPSEQASEASGDADRGP